jgi:hypothetical protein
MINRGAAAAFSTAAATAATAPNAATASVATAATILNPRFALEACTSTSKLQLPTHTPNVRRNSSKTNIFETKERISILKSSWKRPINRCRLAAPK